MSYITELFLDNSMIEVTPGVSRRLHQPKKHLLNPVIRADRWWEGKYLWPYTTIYDKEEKLFKMWARAGSDSRSGYIDGNAAFMTYLTSTDGIHWDKPELGVVDFAGRRDHNIVFTSDLVSGMNTVSSRGKWKFIVPGTPMTPQGKKAFIASVIRHPNPRHRNENYIGLAIIQDHRRGAHIVNSPDGIHWTCEDAPFWQTPHDVSGKGDDCLMNIIYDNNKQKWVVYRRIIPEFSERMIADESDRERKGVDRYNRSYAYAESDDLITWKNHRFILSMDADDRADTELYGFACHKFGHIYVGYMDVYYLHPQRIDIQLATSRDGINFTRVCRGEPFIPSGPLGYYDYMVQAVAEPEPIIIDDTVFIYYIAWNSMHDAIDQPDIQGCGAALATFRRDRFVSLETGNLHSWPCRVITKPFTVQHPRLFLNAATWDKGSIRVEALTRDWQPIAGFTEQQALDVQGDALDFFVKWKNNADFGKLLGKEIRLKFYMTRARIYAMTLSNADRKLCPVDREDHYDKHGDSTPRLI